MTAKKGIFSFFKDPFYFFLLAVGCIGFFFSGYSTSALWVIFVAALTEEIFFRALAQDFLEQHINIKAGPFTLANIIVSAVFAALHLFFQAPVWALLVFFPSLLFGLTWTRYKSLSACSILHFWYNICFYL